VANLGDKNPHFLRAPDLNRETPQGRGGLLCTHRCHSRSLWFLAKVIRLFSNNMGSFSRNLVPKQRMFSGRGVYVLRPLHLNALTLFIPALGRIVFP
jgi:hypothetical protein